MLSSAKAARVLGLNPSTIRKLGDGGFVATIRLPSGHRRYDVSALAARGAGAQAGEASAPGDDDGTKKKYCYCRVSRAHQRADLQRQVESMRQRFPAHAVVTDVASGINFKRRGLQTLLRSAMCGAVGEVVVAHRDRLCRVAFDLLEWVFRAHGVRLVVLNAGDAAASPEAELTEDLMSIVQVFCCRANGRRRYKKALPAAQEAQEAAQDVQEACSDPQPHGQAVPVQG